MVANIVVVVLLTISVFQKSELSPITKTDDAKSINYDVIEEALRLARATIKYIADIINDIVEQARQSIENILKTIVDKEKDVQQGVQETLKRLLDSVVAEIAEAKDKAVEVGVDIAECIDGQAEATKERIEKVTQEIVACVSNKVSEVEQNARELEGLITDALQFSENAGESIMQCFELTNPFRVLDCVITETSHATKQAVSISSTITNKISEAEIFVLLAVHDLTLCSGAKLLKAEELVAEIVRNIETCVDGKLHPSSLLHKTQ